MNYYDRAEADIGEVKGNLFKNIQDLDSCFDVKDLDSLRYVGPRVLAEVVCEYVPEEQRSSVAVVDVAAGAGVVGLEVILHLCIHFITF